MDYKDQIKGFQAAGIAAGIKKDGRKDLGLILASAAVPTVGVFTRNRVQAAPVLLDRQRIGSGQIRAIIVNSGNANCCTGPKGMQDALAMTKAVAEQYQIPPEQVLVGSTGVIGSPLPINSILRAVPELIRQCRPDGFKDFAEAIMTTDTIPKIVSETGTVNGRSFQVVGIAKGAGMIRPDMATLLGFVISDISAAVTDLQPALQSAVDRSFNRISIDGDTSTNDTVLLMAGGGSGVELTDGQRKSAFQRVLDRVMLRLARMLVKDGEGVTKVVEIRVKGAPSEPDARRVVDTVAHSNLVKTAFFGEDANWGRLIAAAGRAGVAFDPNQVDIYFDDVKMVENSTGLGQAAEDRATAILKNPEFRVTIDLKQGSAETSLITCDFSLDYVKINADYRS
jgi:glutamate N-acetyltransferase/amino-acid N-acetyltransferase